MADEKWLVAIQPTFFPSIPLMQRLCMADVIVIMGTAQYDRTHMRAKVLGKDAPIVLNAPLAGVGRKPFGDVKSGDVQKFIDNTMKTLTCCYGKEAMWKTREVQAYMDTVVGMMHQCDNAACMGGSSMIGSLAFCKASLPEYHRDTEVLPERPANPSAWLAALCEAVGATHYVQGKTSMDAYFDRSAFPDDLKLMYQDWQCTPYEQVGARAFQADVSILDAICTLGIDGTKELLSGDRNDYVQEW